LRFPPFCVPRHQQDPDSSSSGKIVRFIQLPIASVGGINFSLFHHALILFLEGGDPEAVLAAGPGGHCNLWTPLLPHLLHEISKTGVKRTKWSK